MNLIICPECGSRISDQEKECPVCGYPLSENVKYQFAPMQDDKDIKKKELEKKGVSVISLLALIFGIMGVVFSLAYIGIVFAIIAIILGIIGIVKRRNRVLAITGLCTALAGVFIFIILMIATIDNGRYKADTEDGEAFLSGDEMKDVFENPDDYVGRKIRINLIAIATPETKSNGFLYIESCRTIDENGKQINRADVRYDDNSFTCNVGDTIKVVGVISKSQNTAGVLNIESEFVTVVETNSDIVIENTEEKVTESGVSPEDVTIEEQTLYDNNGVIIKATGLEKGYFGYTINIYIENNSGLNLGFNAHAYAVNGMMTGDSIYAMDCDVAAGKKANASLDIDSSFIKENEIDVIRNIQILFWAYDNDASYKEFDTGQLTISTTADDGNYNVVTGQNVYDDGSISVDYLYRDGDKFYYCLTNNTDNYFNFDVNNISINDYTVSDIDYDLYDEVILKGCQKIFVIKVENSFKNLNGITDVSKIDFNFGIRPEGNYFKEYTSGMIEQEITAE